MVLRVSNLGLALNRPGQALSPTQPSLRSPTAIKIPLFELPSLTGSGMPNHYSGDGLHTIGMSGLSHVRTELLPGAIVATLTPHPVQMYRQFPRPRYLGNLPSSPHSEMKELIAPLLVTAHRDLRRLDQQKAQQYVALLADVSQSPPLATGLLLGNQPQVAGDLFAAVKTFGRSDRFSSINRNNSCASCRSVFCLRTRLVRISGRISNPYFKPELAYQPLEP